ncbi:MAG: VWA domain-containing protein [Rhodospirillales bacterium]|nr:MAG: VWA domain-containing protein [Rhodospirillales bacterium]
MSSDNRRTPSRPSAGTEVEAFLSRLAATPKAGSGTGGGRLIFALDATASRQPTWDQAAQIQGEMFVETAKLGGLAIQPCFYRGFGEFRAGPWLSDAAALLRLMTSVTCAAGQTQIQKVLRHAVNETRKHRVNALVFVGDCMEEDVDRLGRLAGELGVLGLPAFMFHEGHDPVAEYAFKQVAQLSGGACCRFDQGSARTLRELLNAVAVYAAGGRPALEDLAARRKGAVLRIAHQMKRR